jgi:hypothetical protein
MHSDKTALERAFELARSGKITTVAKIRQSLKAEGYSDSQLIGNALVGQLRDLIRSATKAE